jgi:putative ABC transport system permease protein
MELWIGAITQGAAYALLALAVFLSFRVLRFPDISVDGTFTSGAAIFGVLVAQNLNLWLALGVAFLVGAVGGAITGLIHTRLNINDLLSGIITMTALYSINLRVMGRSNLPVSGAELGYTIFGIALLAVAFLWWFLRTDYGLALRAVGDNPEMSAAQGISVRNLKTVGLSLSNGFAALGGAVIAQYNGFADITMGIGALVTGMAGVMIGERFMPPKSVLFAVGGALVGSVVFRLLIAGALQAGMNPIDLKLITAVFVLIALALPRMSKGRAR